MFLPVVVWNLQHDWISFRFQSVGRWQGRPEFSSHILLESAVALLGPTALAACGWWILRRWRGAPAPLFTAVFVLVPLSVFVVYSLRHAPRLNWTGPLWLALLPAIAMTMLHGPRWLVRLWPPTIALSLLAYAAFLHYAVIGIPGVPYPPRMMRLTGWEDLAAQVADIVRREQAPTAHEPPVVACLDKYWIPSGLSFYLQKHDPRILVTSYQLFGRHALMFDLWHPPASVAGRDLVLVSDDREDFSNTRVRACATLVGPVTEMPVHAPDGSHLGSYWCCTIRGYHPPGLSSPAPSDSEP
jgi:dolichol-phosphate mannosyltransferase